MTSRGVWGRPTESLSGGTHARVGSDSHRPLPRCGRLSLGGWPATSPTKGTIGVAHSLLRKSALQPSSAFSIALGTQCAQEGQNAGGHDLALSHGPIGQIPGAFQPDLRLVPCKLIEFNQHPVCTLRMDEGDQLAAGPDLRLVVDETYPQLLQAVDVSEEIVQD